jgi:phage terminase large subunit-like protein
MASNVVVRMDPAGNMKPDKQKSREKIDGIVALCMALDRAARSAGDPASAYESRGFLSIDLG